MIILLCDGASKGNPGPASIGLIAWDRANNPNIIKPTYQMFKKIGVRTNMEAEWLALINAMSYLTAKRKDVDIAYIYNDSQVVIKQANGLWKIKHNNIKPLYKIFTTFLETDLWELNETLNIIWIPRQLIYLADKEAQKGR